MGRVRQVLAATLAALSTGAAAAEVTYDGARTVRVVSATEVQASVLDGSVRHVVTMRAGSVRVVADVPAGRPAYVVATDVTSALPTYVMADRVTVHVPATAVPGPVAPVGRMAGTGP